MMIVIKIYATRVVTAAAIIPYRGTRRIFNTKFVTAPQMKAITNILRRLKINRETPKSCSIPQKTIHNTTKGMIYIPSETKFVVVMVSNKGLDNIDKPNAEGMDSMSKYFHE